MTTAKINVGLLEVGKPPEDLVDEHENYPSMFTQLIGQIDPDFKFKHYSILDGEYPLDAQECDAWLITGSRHGVYEDHAWIPTISKLIHNAYQQQIPMVGICFGHQLMVQALGGKVVKSTKGWGLGNHHYQIDKPQNWMRDLPDTFSIQAFHQDQVTELPDNTQVLASSEFCEYAALAFGDYAISFQGHPEFAGDYTSKLIETRKNTGLIPEQLSEEALLYIHADNDRELIGQWIADFIRQAIESKLNTAL